MHPGVVVAVMAASLLLTACQRGGDEPAKEAPEPSAATAPPAATPEQAIRQFVEALRARDLEQARDMLITAETCAALAPERVTQCQGVVPELRTRIGELLEAVDTDYVIGSITEAEEAPPGLHIYEVVPQSGDRERTLLLIAAEHDGRHRIAWPIKVEVKTDPSAVPRVREKTDVNQLETVPPAPPSSATQVP